MIVSSEKSTKKMELQLRIHTYLLFAIFILLAYAELS